MAYVFGSLVDPSNLLNSIATPDFQTNVNSIYDLNSGVYRYIGVSGGKDEVDTSSTTGLPALVNASFTVSVPTITKPTKPVGCPAIGAFWYNDFGLEYTRSRIPAPNYYASIWYDWGWNWKNQAGGYAYNPDRHPMLGWYKGDDVDVLGWQVKWLLQHGVDFVICQNPATGARDGLLPDDDGNWATETSASNWIYKLLNTVPNMGASGLKTVFWLPRGTANAASTRFRAKPLAWDSGTAYVINNTALASNGTRYTALTNNTNKEPSANPSDWSATTLPANWNSTTNWLIGDTVINTSFDNAMYIAITNNTNKQPNSNLTDWTKVTMPQEWLDFATFYSQWPNHVHTITRAGGVYPVCFFWECDTLVANLGIGTVKVWLAELGTRLNTLNAGWAGIAVIGNYSPTPTLADGVSYSPGGQLDYDALEAARCVMIRGDYNGTAASHGTSPTSTKYATDADEYQDLITLFPSYYSYRAYAESRRSFGVPTSSVSVPPHGSSFNYKGHSPEKFKLMMQTVLAKYKALDTAGDAIPMVTIYNVSEWAEGGPGLQPNKQDGFGYLTALKDAIDSY